MIYDENITETETCQLGDPRADWPVPSSSGLFNILSVCLRVDPNQRPDMEEVCSKPNLIKSYMYFLQVVMQLEQVQQM